MHGRAWQHELRHVLYTPALFDKHSDFGSSLSDNCMHQSLNTRCFHNTPSQGWAGCRHSGVATPNALALVAAGVGRAFIASVSDAVAVAVFLTEVVHSRAVVARVTYAAGDSGSGRFVHYCCS